MLIVQEHKGGYIMYRRRHTHTPRHGDSIRRIANSCGEEEEEGEEKEKKKVLLIWMIDSTG